MRTSLLAVLTAATALVASPAYADIVIGVESSVQSDALIAVVDQFTKETGIKAEVSQFPYDGWVTQLRTEGAVRAGLFDVVKISAALVGEGVASGYIEPIENFDVGQLDLKDIALFDLAKYTDGKHYMVPYFQEPNGLILRKDLLDDPEEQAAFKAKYGYALDVPKTEAQYLDQLKFFTRPDKNLYGTIIYGKRAAWIQIHFQNLLHARGLEYMDWKTYQPKLGTPEVQKALADWKDLFQYADPASYDADWFSGNANWKAGRAYSIDSWGSNYVYSNDPTGSQIAGKVMMVPYPTELEKVTSFAVQEGLAVTTTSQNRDEAWKFVVWATGKDAQTRAVLDSAIGTIPASYGALADPEVNKKLPLEAIVGLLRNADVIPDSPLLPEGRQINLEILTKYLSMYLTGESTAEQIGTRFDSEINELLKKGGYKTPWLD
jgi:multiple sugar transport system substrate-binding protein